MMHTLQKNTFEKIPLEKLKVLDTCQHIFKHAESFYQYLADVHQEHREVARMWGLFAIDKCNHSDTFKMASRLKGEGISEVCISAEMATNILTKMKSIPTGNGSNPPSIVEALRFAISMEERLNSVYFRHVVKLCNEQDKDLLASSLKSNGTIIHMMTEEYVNLTMFE
jgi:rubrerythrin